MIWPIDSLTIKENPKKKNWSTLPACRCVPAVFTSGPRQLSGETFVQIVVTPRKYHLVVDIV